MGGKDERALIQKFIDFGFGSYRYPQPAIRMKEKYQRPDFTHVRREQPVDLLVNGLLNVSFADGSKRDIFFRIGVEQKTTNGWSFTQSMIDEKSHSKFINFCRKNCLIPVYIVTFTMNDRIKYGFSVGSEAPYSLRYDDADWQFDDMLSKLLGEYIRVYDTFIGTFNVVELEFEGE